MWDERFSSLEYIYGTEPNDFLVSVVSKIPQGKVLCLADGEGRNGTYLASLGCKVELSMVRVWGLPKRKN